MKVPGLFLMYFLITPAHGFTFVFTINNNISPCRGKQFLPFSDLFDGQNLEVMSSDDGDIGIVNGNMTVLKDLQPEVVLQLSVERNERGGWTPLPYAMEVMFCQRLVAPSEVWYTLTQHFTPAERKCPPKKGVSASTILNDRGK